MPSDMTIDDQIKAGKLVRCQRCDQYTKPSPVHKVFGSMCRKCLGHIDDKYRGESKEFPDAK